MKKTGIEHLVYILKEAQKQNTPKPIFFLGAGASQSGNIPLAGEIVKDVLRDYSENPSIKDFASDKVSYAQVMECLLPEQRRTLFQNYIAAAKINITHISVAQLLKENYIDYVLTVNFDNLLLRALALFNIFPASYDMAILKDLTTTTFEEKSLVYLHGQSHGLWQLNTLDEMKKIQDRVPRVFDSIKNRRPWVFIGYSGDDLTFDHIKNFGRFDSGLYWLTYLDTEPSPRVKDFLSHVDTNAFVIKGYDADSFMLKLNSALGLEQAHIINRPFSALKEMLSGIVDIKNEEPFKGVCERFAISQRQVDEAIEHYEEGIIKSTAESQKSASLDLLKREIINIIIAGRYEASVIDALEKKAAPYTDTALTSMRAILFFNWGNTLSDSAGLEKGEASQVLYYEAIEKYKKAVVIKPDACEVLYNWGTVLSALAGLAKGEVSQTLYNEAIEKYKKAVAIQPDYYEALCNWGTVLSALAGLAKGEASQTLYHEAIEKYKKAVAIQPDYYEAFFNWGGSLCALSGFESGEKKQALYNEAIEKYQKAKALGGKCYNMACVYSLCGNKTEALKYVEISLKTKEITAAYAKSDTDFSAYADDADFINLLNHYAD